MKDQKMPKSERKEIMRESIRENSEAKELSDDTLEAVAGGKTSCIPTDPVTSDELPMPQFPTIKELL